MINTPIRAVSKPDDAFGLVKDSIRYTFQYPDEKYAQGVHADCARLEAAGFQRGDRQGTWENDQYKGINSRWREPESGLLFEVQFHTQASFEAKQQTHWAYERIRDTPTPAAEVRQLRDYQREVSAKGTRNYRPITERQGLAVQAVPAGHW